MRKQLEDSVLLARKTVFVHDNFVQAGGGERVAEQLAKCLPDADIATTVLVNDRLSTYIQGRQVKTTWLQHFPGMKRFYRHYFLFFPLAARSLDLSSYQRVISSCYGFAKMVRKAPGATHICYCHTPTRWIWRFEDYAGRERFNWLTGTVLRLLVRALRRFDLSAAQSVDFFIANSKAVAERIHFYYGRESVVIYPPIEVSRFACSADTQDYYLLVSRMSAYKRIDLAIKACERLGRPLKIVGDGPDRTRLRKMAGTQTEFLGRLPDAEVSRLMASCRALLFPGEEDFGLTPLEASASGRPCIAFGRGGALDTVVPGLNGVHFLESTAESLADGILRCEATSWDKAAMRAHAERFDVAAFGKRFCETIERFERGRSVNLPLREHSKAS